jgi:hypothetical protein
VAAATERWRITFDVAGRMIQNPSRGTASGVGPSLRRGYGLKKLAAHPYPLAPLYAVALAKGRAEPQWSRVTGYECPEVEQLRSKEAGGRCRCWALPFARATDTIVFTVS